MINKWNEYSILNENIAKAKSILKSLNLNEDDQQFLKLKELLIKHPGYIGKFTEWLFKDKVTLEQLFNLYRRIVNTKLTKAIDQYKSPEEVIDSIIRIDADTAVNQMINSIPSRTREYLKSTDCNYCDGDKIMNCEPCDGDGKIDCEKCDGQGEIECTVCDGQCSVECKPCKGDECDKCDGYEEVVCKSCKGEGYSKCKDCQGKSTIECKACKSSGTTKCTHCVDESIEWIEFKKFLALQKDNKDIIIDLFSKKGGRYGDEYEEQSEVLDRIKSDITRLIDCASIDDIKTDAIKKVVEVEIEKYDSRKGEYVITKTKLPSIGLVYDDDKLLIVAVNYNGIKKYGSSYWCITEDEDTFNDYVYGYDTLNVQLITYVKGKVPFVDDRSVIGITYDLKTSSVSAAHWEDDSDARSDATKMLRHINIDKQTLFNVLGIYDYEQEQLDGLIIAFPTLFKDKIEEIVKLNIKETSKKRKSNDKLYAINNLILHSEGDTDDLKPLIEVLKEILDKYDFKFPSDDIEILELGLTSYVAFNDKWHKKDFSDLFKSFKGKERDDLFKLLKDNGYDFKKFGNIDNILEHFIKNEVLPLSEIYKLVKKWDLRHLDSDTSCKLYNWVLDNDFAFILTKADISKIFIKYIVVNEYLEKYKDKIIDALKKNLFKKEINDYIIDEIDDDEIDILAARNLISKRLQGKYQIDFKRFEGMMSFKDFKNINKDETFKKF